MHFDDATRSKFFWINLLPRPSSGALLEAWWKQEGTKCCRFLRNPAHGVCRAGGFNWRKCRRNTQTSAIVHGPFDTTHNLKVVGSNPTPATKKLHVIKRLNAVLRGGVCVSNTRGSTVEARGREFLRADARPVPASDHRGAFAEAVVQALRSEVPVPAAFQTVMSGASPAMLHMRNSTTAPSEGAAQHAPGKLNDASHLFFRRRERAMLRFRRVGVLKFAAVRASVFNLFNQERSLSSRQKSQAKARRSSR